VSVVEVAGVGGGVGQAGTQPAVVVLASPAGPLSVLVAWVDARWTVVASGFGLGAGDLALVAAGGQPGMDSGEPDAGIGESLVSGLDVLDVPGAAADVRTREVVAAVRAWASGDLEALRHVAVARPSGRFVAAAADAMRSIPPGVVRTYAWLAAAAGSPTAKRAAGQACARNRVAPFVPCHRILRGDGGSGGYAYGLETKRALLAHEGVAVTW
jgi:methylated-DNA-[protein]-cysteine S-methyltransferase